MPCITIDYTLEIRTKTKVKRQGNLLGLIIPNKIVIKEELQPNNEIEIIISKKQDLEEFFGKGKNKIINIQKEKDEIKKIWRMN